MGSSEAVAVLRRRPRWDAKDLERNTDRPLVCLSKCLVDFL